MQKEDRWAAREAKRWEQEEVAEKQKEEDKRQRAVHAKELQLKQLAELEKSLIDQKLVEKKEGEALTLKVKEEAIKERAAIKERRKIARAQAVSTQQENLTMQAERKKLLDDRAILEEQKIRLFADEKERILIERQTREAERIQQKNSRRDKMTRRLQKTFLKMAAVNEGRLQRQQAELEDKVAAREAEAAEKREHMVADILQSNDEQVKHRKKYEKRLREDDVQLAEQIRDRNEVLLQEEEEEKAAIFAHNVRIQGYHKWQMERKEVKAVKQAVYKQVEASEAERLTVEEEKKFAAYTKECMAEWAAEGKSLRPMELELHKQSQAHMRLNY